MNTYFMMGKYTLDQARNIASHRVDQLEDVISGLGGRFVRGWTLENRYDLILIVELPSREDAESAALKLGELIGVLFHALPAMPLDEFDDVVERRTVKIESARMEAGE